MNEDQEVKHMCKFCYKSFRCGRSLGGHMRSHLIHVSSPDHPKTDQKLPKKELPPLSNAKNNAKTVVLVQGSGQLGNDLRENPKKTRKFSKTSDQEEDTLPHEKLCKECGKSFQSLKALFGHMKCHSVNGRAANSMEEDSWNSSSNCQKLIVDSKSDNETVTPFCRRKRSDRIKRYTSTTTNSSSLNFSPCISEIDQQEEAEVALSLIMLSRDMGNWAVMNSVVESSGTSPRRELKVSADEFHPDNLVECKNLRIGRNESEVNSPKNLMKKSGLDQFGSDCKKKKSSKRKCIYSHDSELSMPLMDYKLGYGPSDLEKSSKFMCIICGKDFPSYQALGGHRASHKKLKGCCAPTSENSIDTENSPNQSENMVGVFAEKMVGWKKNKEHECPICFRIFPSGQALGGHKRSHLVGDHQAKSTDPSVCNPNPVTEMHDFLDLNLPAPVEEEEEECNELKPWWIGTSHKHKHKHKHQHQPEPLLGLLSS